MVNSKILKKIMAATHPATHTAETVGITLVDFPFVTRRSGVQAPSSAPYA